MSGVNLILLVLGAAFGWCLYHFLRGFIPPLWRYWRDE